MAFPTAGDLPAGYAASTSLAHRKRFGQFFTGEQIASFMAGWALAGGATELYDPAFGLGAFYQAAARNGARVAFSGTEIDAKILDFWRAQAGAAAPTVLNEDYLQGWGRLHAAIVCNPPYMRFQKFLDRKQVFRVFEQVLGLKLPGHTNLASAFLIKSIAELRPGGRLAYIMPLEFLNTGYGAVVKRELLAQGRLHAIIRLDCEQDAFPGVITSAGILLFEKGAAPAMVRFAVVRRLDELDGLLERRVGHEIPQAALQPQEKWLKLFDPGKLRLRLDGLVPLSTYGFFSRGIATGANQFFVLRRSRVASLGLGLDEVLGCVTRSPQITRPTFTDRDFEALAVGDAPVFLLNLNGELSEAAAAAVRQGQAQGFDQRYLTQARRPWYRLERRSPAPILLGVFSRAGYRVVRNRSQALNLTCYHGFHPNPSGQQYVDALFLYLLSAAGREILALNRREYGDALDKFEPNDLNQALAPGREWFEKLGEQEVQAEMVRVAATGRLSSEFEARFEQILSF